MHGAVLEHIHQGHRIIYRRRNQHGFQYMNDAVRSLQILDCEGHIIDQDGISNDLDIDRLALQREVREIGTR